MLLSLAMKLFACLVFLLFVAGAFSQNIRFPSDDWQYEGSNSCRRDSSCLARSRCPPSRRVRNAPQCFYNGGYYRRAPGVCCRNRNAENPFIYSTLPPATTAVYIEDRYPPFLGNDVQVCQRDARCVAISRCPPSRRPRMRNAPPCSYEGFYSRNLGVCCAYTMGRGLRPIVPDRIPDPIPEPIPDPIPEPIPDPIPDSIPDPNPDPIPDSIMMSTTIAPSPVSSPNDDCGRSLSTSGFMIGGTTARPGVWPWMVAITKRERDGTFSVWCTGSLLDRTHVLTAAHCFDQDRDVTLYTLRIGNIDQRLGDAYSIESLAIPDGYSIGRFYSDLAVITMDRPMNTPDFMPICLPDSTFVDFSGTGVTLAGWGSTTPGGPTSDILQQLNAMPVISTNECDSTWRGRMASFNVQFPNGINSDFICAGFLEGGRDSCGGDSGGPMMIPQDGRWIQIGIVSFGHSTCATPGFPAGYTRVSSFVDFIRRNL